jgi:hypothetical protein
VNMSTVLRNMAEKVRNEVKDFDNTECVAIQYHNFSSFFLDMTHSRGWTEIQKENKFQNTEEAQHKMIDLLNEELEK